MRNDRAVVASLCAHHKRGKEDKRKSKYVEERVCKCARVSRRALRAEEMEEKEANRRSKVMRRKGLKEGSGGEGEEGKRNGLDNNN